MDQNTVAAGEAEFDPARERTTLVNALAEAARAALDFDFISAAVLGAIPGTEPQQYVIAGTPDGISKMLQAIAAPSPVSEAQAEQIPRPANWPIQSFDARDWAHSFMSTFAHRRDEVDEALMLTWFSCALMRGFDERVWQTTAKEAEQASAQAATTDLSRRLRTVASCMTANQPNGVDLDASNHALLTQAADEIERYYGGMLNWKRTAEAKDSGAQTAAAEVRDAARDVLAERRRQVDPEGMTSDGDDRYHAAELPRAAAAYILNGANDEAPYIWPWAKSWWKPRDARANYVRAAALLLAEIERIDRAAIRSAVGTGEQADGGANG